MGMFERVRRRGSTPSSSGGARVRGIDPTVVAHLEGFATSRVGVEAYVEPPTTVSEMTMVLVARDGEWTRRRVPDGPAAAALGAKLGVPVYDVHATGYPPRMREWSARQKRGENRPARAEDELFAALEKDLGGADEA